MVPLDRALVSSYRLSLVTMSLTAAVWPQFAMQVFWGGIGRLTCIGSYVNKQVTTFTFRAQATTCSKHHTQTVMDAGCECAPWVRSANPSDSWALVDNGPSDSHYYFVHLKTRIDWLIYYRTSLRVCMSVWSVCLCLCLSSCCMWSVTSQTSVGTYICQLRVAVVECWLPWAGDIRQKLTLTSSITSGTLFQVDIIVSNGCQTSCVLLYFFLLFFCSISNILSFFGFTC